MILKTIYLTITDKEKNFVVNHDGKSRVKKPEQIIVKSISCDSITVTMFAYDGTPDEECYKRIQKKILRLLEENRKSIGKSEKMIKFSYNELTSK